MDITILLVLQQFRMSLPGYVEDIVAAFSSIGDGPVLVILTLAVYWCIDKKTGQFAFFAFASGNFANQLVKNIACVYRPWIRDASIVPAPASVEGAGGYSFPSGHTTGTATSLGSFAWLGRKNHKVLGAIFILIILCMMFSRLFLGVHTLQDVLVGLLIAVVAIAGTQLFMNWIGRCDAEEPAHRKDIATMVVMVVIAILSLVYVVLKPYPLDYVNGVLLVDPVTMQKGSFEAAGIVIGMACGWVCERRLVDFSTSNLTMGARILRLVVGVIIAAGIYVGLGACFKAIMPYNWAKLVTMIIFTFANVFLVPLLFKTLEKRYLASDQLSP